MNFYDEVLRELIAAVGAALFFGNLVALLRRRKRQSAPARPARAAGPGDERPSELTQAPLARTLLYMALGFVIMIWGIASVLAS